MVEICDEENVLSFNRKIVSLRQEVSFEKGKKICSIETLRNRNGTKDTL